MPVFIMFIRLATYCGLRPSLVLKRTMLKCSVCSMCIYVNTTFGLRLRKLSVPQRQLFHSNQQFNAKKPAEHMSGLVPKDFFDKARDKSKESYLDMIRIYEGKDRLRRGHVEFIYAALRHMEEFGVHRDVEVYKNLVDVFPKGKFIPRNIFQAEFMHYPKQQQCAIDLLEQMEDNGVMPDMEMEDILLNIFGKRGHPVQKYWRMMYWMPKFKNLSPWLLPNPVPSDSLELAKLALMQMSSVDLQSKVDVFQASELQDSLDHTWIVSAQSPIQQELIQKHPKDVAVFVEGAFQVCLRRSFVSYFILRADAQWRPPVQPIDTDIVDNLKVGFFQDEPEDTSLVKFPSVHEQDDGTILAMCATGTSSRDSLLSWIRFLEVSNPQIGEIPVLFTLKSPLGAVVPVGDSSSAEDDPQRIKSLEESGESEKNRPS